MVCNLDYLAEGSGRSLASRQIGSRGLFDSRWKRFLVSRSILKLHRSSTPRAVGIDDSLSVEPAALCCQPVEVGLASEARSTTKGSAKAEGRARSALGVAVSRACL